LELQAARSGNGNGRVYTIVVQCTDATGAISTSTVTVAVAHNQSKLSHNRNGHNLNLSWDPTDTESVLESTDSLESPDWKPVTTAPDNQLTVPADGASKFYRLRQ
jgi:hypothetical protein